MSWPAGLFLWRGRSFFERISSEERSEQIVSPVPAALESEAFSLLCNSSCAGNQSETVGQLLFARDLVCFDNGAGLAGLFLVTAIVTCRTSAVGRAQACHQKGFSGSVRAASTDRLHAMPVGLMTLANRVLSVSCPVLRVWPRVTRVPTVRRVGRALAKL